MEFRFDVNGVIRDRIEKIEPATLKGRGSRRADDARSKLVEIIDRIGEASGKAQDLQAPVTTSEKFLSSDHTIYIMKDPEGNRGRGTVVGLLKIGHKKLFLLDSLGTQNELTPLCILDFYVHESQQRKGFGKQLFQHMLEDEKIEPCSLAIDRPSSKFISFFRKHYNLFETIPQVNNFTIFKAFFKDSRRASDAAAHRYSDPPGLLSFQLRDQTSLEQKLLSKSMGPTVKTSSRIIVKEPSSDRRNPLAQVQNVDQENALPAVRKHFDSSNDRPVQQKQSSLDLICCNRTPRRLGSSKSDNTLETLEREKQNGAYSLAAPQAKEASRTSSPDYKQDYPVQLSSGRPRAARDSSLNIFGIPASWNQRAQETLQY